ncbi:hypothetical protein WA158_007348 [Blastocystis sp. Blastoise]
MKDRLLFLICLCTAIIGFAAYSATAKIDPYRKVKIAETNRVKNAETLVEPSEKPIEDFDYDSMPICHDTALYTYTIGGLGNQIILFIFTYAISIVHKIPIYYPSDSVFDKFLIIKNYFPGQVNVFNDTRTTDRTIDPKENEKVIDINRLTATNNFIRSLQDNTICKVYAGKKLILTGYQDAHKFLLPLDIYKKILGKFSLYSESIYKYVYPYPVYRFENLFLQESIIPNPIVQEHMASFFPDYNSKRFLSVHLRFGGGVADYKDIESRMAHVKPDYVVHYIEAVCNKTKENIVYLASDSTNMKNYIKEHLPKTLTVITAPIEKVASTDLFIAGREVKSKYEIDAVTELFLLRHGSDCIGSMKSSFSKFACSNIDHEGFLLTSDTKNNIV